MSGKKITKKAQPDHPSLAKLALIVNQIHNHKISGSPRSIAEQIISLVFKGETEKWAGVDDLYEGGQTMTGVSGARVVQNGSQTVGTHHRRVLVFYGEWEEGSPRVPNGHPLTGEMPTRPVSGPPQPPASGPVGTPASAATHSINFNLDSVDTVSERAIADIKAYAARYRL